jgi:putative addiction module component (TIGR02574 family)
MSFDIQSLGLDRLTVVEKLDLVDLILESLPDPVHPAELSEAQWSEINRRCAAADANPGQGKPWREVLDRAERNLQSRVEKSA